MPHSRTVTASCCCKAGPETVWANKKSAAPPAKSYATGIEGVLGTLLSPLAAREARPNKNPERRKL
jgi:hypothetical protein